MRSRSLPARPTKGLPCRSSSRPGASPISISLASSLPRAKHSGLRRALQRAALEGRNGFCEFGKRLDPVERWSAAAFAGGAGRAPRLWRGLGRVLGAALGALASGRIFGARRGGGLREAVDRRIADGLVDAHGRVPGKQARSLICGAFTHLRWAGPIRYLSVQGNKRMTLAPDFVVGAGTVRHHEQKGLR